MIDNINAGMSNNAVHDVNTNSLVEGRDVIYNYFSSINMKDEKTFLSLVGSKFKNFYENYFKDDRNIYGIKQIKDVSVEEIYDISVLDAEKYYVYGSDTGIMPGDVTYPYIVKTKCSVTEENQYFCNGFNYMFMVLTKQNGKMIVSQTTRPSTYLMKKYIIDNEEVYGNLDGTQKKAVEAVLMCNRGLLVNSKCECLTNGVGIVNVNNNSSVKTTLTMSHYSTYTYPYYIRVKLNKTGNDAIKSVKMSDYIKCTLPNEWMASWPENSLIAGAYCVKMVGIYRAINPVNAAAGYDASQGTQNYIPGRDNSITNSIVDRLINCGMADTSGCLFFPSYAKGTSGATGTRASGQLKQYGSKKLAENGYSYKQILNYYYSGSSVSYGDVNLFGYNIGY